MPEFLLHVHPCAFKRLYYPSTLALLKPERICRWESGEDTDCISRCGEAQDSALLLSLLGARAAAQPGWKIQHVVHAFCANVSQLRHPRL